MEGERGSEEDEEEGCWTEVYAGSEFNAVHLDPEQPHCRAHAVKPC